MYVALILKIMRKLILFVVVINIVLAVGEFTNVLHKRILGRLLPSVIVIIPTGSNGCSRNGTQSMIDTINWFNGPFTVEIVCSSSVESFLIISHNFSLHGELLDKNQLYVNYSEIDDENFKISKLDKKLTKEFYFGE